MQESCKINTICFKQLKDSLMDFQLSELQHLRKLNDLFIWHPHQNDFYQLIFYTKGNGQHKVDLETYHFHAHTLIPIAKGQVQFISCSHDSEAYILSFTEDFLNRYHQDMEWFYHLRLFDSHQQAGAIFPEPEDCREFIFLIRQMQSELQRKPLGTQNDIIRDLLRIFINRSERLLDHKAQHQTDNNDYYLFCSFRHALASGDQACHSVKAYANQLCITPKKLNQLTLKYAKKNAKEMINERLLVEIKRLLLYTSMTIKAISAQSGFNDPTNFVKFFKRHMNITPEKYRQFRKNSAN